MTDKRITDLQELTEITAATYVPVRNDSQGTRKYNLKSLNDTVKSAAALATSAAAQANDAKDAAIAATSTATQAAETATDATDRAEAAIAAIGDISELAVPLMSEDTRGGAKQGSGLKVSDGALSLGDIVTDSHDGPMYSAHGEGWAEQDGTPTLDNPVEIRVARGRNLLNPAGFIAVSGGPDTIIDGVISDSTPTGDSRSFDFSNSNWKITVKPGTYTISWIKVLVGSNANAKIVALTQAGTRLIDVALSAAASYATFTVTDETTIGILAKIYDYKIRLQLELGSTPTPYVPYGHVGLEVRNAATQELVDIRAIPLPLKSDGERWAGGLPDGTADALTIDSAGRYEWAAPMKFTTQAVTDGVSGTVGVDVMSSTGQIADGATVLYASTPVTEHGYIDLPDVPEGATIDIPELREVGVRCFVPGARELAEHAANWGKRNAEMESRLAALEAAVAELATS